MCVLVERGYLENITTIEYEHKRSKFALEVKEDSRRDMVKKTVHQRGIASVQFKGNNETT